MSRAKEILDFWFCQPDKPEYGKPRQIWFNKNPRFDEEIHNRFFLDYQKAVTGHFNEWKNEPESCLALILLLDQFPRNMFRGTPDAFATDWEALSVAQQAIANGFDREMLTVQRWFIYLPFEHSENLEHQNLAVQLFQQLQDDPGSASAINYAVRHRYVIQRFGRFPHRNAILGRVSTPEEQEFLAQPGSLF